ncbi:unnamed protein product [Paramecium pentaurelia]|uniref:Uncharacterized protein n=1 Tax=Paramecium pentaurelia TaxID=43138 RepID=A0A8S1V3Z0_9CILI|nr:unnamed protein product [Paramecium pentaurelia]
MMIQVSNAQIQSIITMLNQYALMNLVNKRDYIAYNVQKIEFMFLILNIKKNCLKCLNIFNKLKLNVMIQLIR